jgi:hypothetical protein
MAAGQFQPMLAGYGAGVLGLGPAGLWSAETYIDSLGLAAEPTGSVSASLSRVRDVSSSVAADGAASVGTTCVGHISTTCGAGAVLAVDVAALRAVTLLTGSVVDAHSSLAKIVALAMSAAAAAYSDYRVQAPGLSFSAAANCALSLEQTGLLGVAAIVSPAAQVMARVLRASALSSEHAAGCLLSARTTTFADIEAALRAGSAADASVFRARLISSALDAECVVDRAQLILIAQQLARAPGVRRMMLSPEFTTMQLTADPREMRLLSDLRVA